MYRILFLFALISGALLYCTCTGTVDHKKKLADELRMFKETAIILPSNMLYKGHDGHLPDPTLLNRPLKMVVYINSENCESCKLQTLIPMHIFIIENRHNKNFGIIVILSPSNIESAESFLEEMRFRQTVFYDLDGSFERLNPHLQKNENFHTFLLDEENKVILIGNPVRNTKLKNLYFKELNKYH
jgi:hypothetical protein